MESPFIHGNAEEHQKVTNMIRTRILTYLKRRPQNSPLPSIRMFASDRGVALITALIITLVVFLMVASTLYLVTQGTKISGPRKVYKTACEASDGAVEITKDAIEKTIANLQIPGGTNLYSTAFANCLTNAVNVDGVSCTENNFQLPMSTYTAIVTVKRLYKKALPGGSIQFPPKAMGNSIGIYYRINTVVSGASGVACENSVLYRHVI